MKWKKEIVMQKILKYMRKAIDDYQMIEEGDKIAVALSGGKDSITLLMALKRLQQFYPKKFDLIAISINPGFAFFNVSFLKDLCHKIDVPLIIESYSIKEVVFDIRKEKRPCSLCANLRRGILNTTAVREGCTKIALGHNEDDMLETFIMNLFYAGRIDTFAPVSFLDRSKITSIRPLIATPEKEIRSFIRRQNIEVMPKNCPMDGKSNREHVKEMIQSWEKDFHGTKKNMVGAIRRSSMKGWKKE